jgi:hypothetical protein
MSVCKLTQSGIPAVHIGYPAKVQAAYARV